MITVLTGGTGGAKFVDGLRQMTPPEELTIIVNIGDDLRWWACMFRPRPRFHHVCAGRKTEPGARLGRAGRHFLLSASHGADGTTGLVQRR